MNRLSSISLASDWKTLLKPLESNGRLCISELHGSAKAFFLYSLQRTLQRPLLIISANPENAEILWRDLAFFSGPGAHAEGTFQATDPAIQYPAWDVLPAEFLSPSPEISIERLRALEQLRAETARFVVAPLEAALQRTFPREIYEKAVFTFDAGQEISRGSVMEHLLRLAYRPSDPVESPGDFKSHGGILDLFSPLYSYPVRIEFFGDQVESMRFFDPESQKSLQAVDQVKAIPTREVPLLEKSVENALNLLNRSSANQPDAASRIRSLKEGLDRLEFFPGIESLSPFLYPHLENLISYFARTPVLVLDEPQDLQRVERELRANFLDSSGNESPRDSFLPAPESFYISLSELSTAENCPVVELSALNLAGDPSYIPFPLVTEAARPYGGRIREFLHDLQGWYKKGERTILVAPTAARRQRLAGFLQENELGSPAFESFEELVEEIPEELPVPHVLLGLCLGELSTGFGLPALGFRLLTDDDIFHSSTTTRKPRTGVTRDGRDRLHDFRDLNEGDFVVHMNYGIGLYLGLKTLETQGLKGDFLDIEYADHDKLYLPVELINLVQKYRGAGSTPPRLDKLGSSSWESVKKRVKKSLKEMAEELLKLYARRQIAVTTPFSKNTQWHQEFAAAFEFEETEDQQAAIDDTQRDMEQSRPMDRLICGDVGYGKTEVAIRAAFKAAYDGNQVVVVVPTTLLAQQHFQTFKARFAPYPISVDVLSRFRSPREQKEILRRLHEGTLDVLIGTHRLLQKDVIFKNLALVVIDEEQRFGVRHKERLKQLRESVHILTLTATPIPRTLQMSLSGFRDLSVIDTPPADRLAIRTLIRRFSERILREAVGNEFSRGGQIFFVHNRVESILSMEIYLRRLFPQIRIAVAHGQMHEKVLERVMVQFIERKIDLLLCSTIIESGLDIPAANTIIINRADRMGLSQLYQLRGRVGRDRLQAYAYLLVPGEDLLSAKAKKRLQAILELSTLGSGFRLAMRDLEIRGAGNLLGARQSGHIAAVGFDLYCKLLEEAVAELKGEKVPEKVETKVSLNADGYIPRSYLPDPKERLMIYKRLYSIQEPSRLEDMEKELRDRFGHLPPPVERLVQTVQIRVLAAPLKILRVERSNQHLTLTFHQGTPLSAARLLELADKNPNLRFIGEDTLQVKLNSSRWETVFPEVKNLLHRLEGCATVP